MKFGRKNTQPKTSQGNGRLRVLKGGSESEAGLGDMQSVNEAEHPEPKMKADTEARAKESIRYEVRKHLG